MDELEFKRICVLADDILLASNTTPERMAINWLHIRRADPISLLDYNLLFETNENIFLLRKFFKSLRKKNFCY